MGNKMNIDFLILVVIYLSIILAIHYKLKSYDYKPKTKSTILKESPSFDELDDIKSEIDSEVNLELETELENDTIDSKLIIDKTEFDKIEDNISNDFLKYLKVEEN